MWIRDPDLVFSRIQIRVTQKRPDPQHWSQQYHWFDCCHKDKVRAPVDVFVGVIYMYLFNLKSKQKLYTSLLENTEIFQGYFIHAFIARILK